MLAGNFFQTTRAALTALSEGEISVTAYAIHGALSSFCNGDRQAYPKVAHLAEMIGRRRDAVISGLAELEKAGLIQKQRRRGQATLYTVPIPPQGSRTPPQGSRADPTTSDSKSRTDPTTSDSKSRISPTGRSDQSDRTKGTRTTKLEPLEKNMRVRVDSTDQNYLFPEVWEDHQRQSALPRFSPSKHLGKGTTLDIPDPLESARPAIEKWLMYKAEQFGFRYKQIGLDQQLKKLLTFGGPSVVTESIENSIASGWKGLFPPNKPTNGKQNGKVPLRGSGYTKAGPARIRGTGR